VSAKLQSLIISYCGSLPRDVEALEHSLTLAAGSAADASAHLAEALARVHRIKGAGGSLGFEAVSGLAAELEAHLRCQAPAVVGEEELQSALESLRRLRQLADSVRPEASTLYGADLRQLSRARARAG
jgi:HPt (histidine-containing phosphotransfer) domain-containing protein